MKSEQEIVETFDTINDLITEILKFEKEIDNSIVDLETTPILPHLIEGKRAFIICVNAIYGFKLSHKLQLIDGER